MSGRLNHRPVPSSRSDRSASSASRGNNGLASSHDQTKDKKKTRSRTHSGERLPKEDRLTIKNDVMYSEINSHWEVHPYQGSRKPPTVIGSLVREMYPDSVDTTEGLKPVLTWEYFKRTNTQGIPNDERVLAEFWGNIGGTDYSHEDGEDYDNGGEGYYGHEGDEYNSDGGYYSHGRDDDLDFW